ncbi:MAG: hypothetical protein SOZ90_07760, partial [Candidatus Faecousia sp.]|nr:hypothetical protein [Candidatus Faecousia sp.]
LLQQEKAWGFGFQGIRIRPGFLVPQVCTALQSGLRPGSFTFYGIAATGSYHDFESLRDAPPGGEAYGNM